VSTLTLAAAQFTGTPRWEENLETCLDYVALAAKQDVDLLVLPEAALRTRSDDDTNPPPPQTLDGPFVEGLTAATAGTGTTVIVGTVEQTQDPRPSNTLVAMSDGELQAVYRKIHLYDAFTRKESDRVLPGDGPLEVFDVKGFSVGMMTCYDVRFPEVARALAIRGADLLALPASWVSGPYKEMHWTVMTQARALENTCFVITSGKTGPNRIGMSSVIDPLGVFRAQLGHAEGMLVTTIDKAELDEARRALPLLDQRRIGLEAGLRPVDELTTTVPRGNS
jgi:predicted amidohydrolase